jgi:hypothetical protein
MNKIIQAVFGKKTPTFSNGRRPAQTLLLAPTEN